MLAPRGRHSARARTRSMINHQFSIRLEQIRKQCTERLGRPDVEHLRAVDRVSRGFELCGRALVHFGAGPHSFVLGTLCLAVFKQLQNAEIGHTALHGVYDRFPEIPRFHRARFRWRAPVHEESWVRMHNSTHHPFTNIAGKDPDLHFGPIRLSEETPWEPYHRLNLPMMFVAHCFHMSLTTLYYSGYLDSLWVTGGHEGQELRLKARDAVATKRGALLSVSTAMRG